MMDAQEVKSRVGGVVADYILRRAVKLFGLDNGLLPRDHDLTQVIFTLLRHYKIFNLL